MRCRLFLIISILAVLLLSASCWPFAEEKASLPEDTPESLIKGTPIETIKEDVQESVKSGTPSVSIQNVLSGSGTYTCTINHEDTFIGLTVKNNLLREDILWENNHTIAYIMEDKLYRYSEMYQKWLMFTYSPEEKLFNNLYKTGILSHSELRALPEGEILCIAAQVSAETFDLPAEEAIDAEYYIEALDNLGK